MPPRVSDRAILANFGIDRAERGKPDQLCPRRHPQPNRRRDRDAHTGVRTRTKTHDDEIGRAELLRSKLQIFEEQPGGLAVVRKADSEWITFIGEPRNAPLRARKFQSENLHCGFESV